MVSICFFYNVGMLLYPFLAYVYTLLYYICLNIFLIVRIAFLSIYSLECQIVLINI